MNTKLHCLFIALASLADIDQAAAQGAQFFRIAGSTNTTIIAFRQDGTIVWSNALPGTNYTVQTTSSLIGVSNWVDFIQLPVSQGVNSNKLVDFNPPSGMAFIPAGEFTIGNSVGDSDIGDAYPTNVTVSAFYIDVNLVTYGQWQTIYNWATSIGYVFVNSGNNNPVNQTVHPVNQPVWWVDWYDCLKWCNARSQLASLTPAYYTDAGLTQVFTNGEPTNVFANWAVNGYRLPTEAEWEKAARGGLSGQRFPWGNTISESQANYSGNPSLTYDFGPGGFNATAHTIAVADNNGNYPYTTPSGLFPPNGYGLYDMAGNVAEWCWDWYAGPTTAGSPYLGGNDPHGPASSPFQSRVERGGNFALFASVARSAYRGADLPSDGTPFFNTLAGFRCVRAH